jgi:hypothetical protein
MVFTIFFLRVSGSLGLVWKFQGIISAGFQNSNWLAGEAAEAPQAAENQKNAVILSEAKNLSVGLCLHLDRREILRFAQNDNTTSFIAPGERPRHASATLDKRLQSKQSGASGYIRILHFPKKDN